MKTKKTRVFLTALFVTTIGHAADTTYDPATGTVTIPEVAVNGKVEFVNVKLKANSDGTFSILSTEAPKASPSTSTYDPAANTVTIPSVVIGGKVEHTNVKLALNPDGTLSVLSTEAPPVPDSLSCSTYVPGTNICDEGKYPTCLVTLSQAAQIKDGMTYDQVVGIIGCHGVLENVGSGGYTSYRWGTDSVYSADASFLDGKLAQFIRF
ncbi:hypothetical protein [Methylobacter sp. BlB1]|uniref:hypothetical protein n=1 Tax=Methylobacter sp. BlB1 TaxID=2785914 RepID=UPI00189549CA|nr:hypothetical protein [Methylobacter sp. BlB1]MBF6649813.1 hypothetical protein [Methylobacter sp. BlB1]